MTCRRAGKTGQVWAGENRPCFSYFYMGLDYSHRAPTIGLIAQDVEPLFPSLVYASEHTRAGDNMKAFNYSGLSVVAIAALQELKSEEDQEIASLQTKNAELEARLDRIESLMNKASQ